MDPAHHGSAAAISKYTEYHTQHKHGNKCSRYRTPESCLIFGSKQSGNHHRSTQIHAHRKGHVDDRNRVGCSHRPQCRFPRKFSRDHAVRNIVKLLEYHTDHQRQQKTPEDLIRMFLCQICDHLYPSICLLFTCYCTRVGIF